jgi:hypothetical protein
MKTFKNGSPRPVGGCYGCSPSRINGVFCHEYGCPEAWKDKPKTCFMCGCEIFVPNGVSEICPECEMDEEMEFFNDK